MMFRLNLLGLLPMLGALVGLHCDGKCVRNFGSNEGLVFELNLCRNQTFNRCTNHVEQTLNTGASVMEPDMLVLLTELVEPSNRAAVALFSHCA